jgi:hypothetical protein
MGKPWNNESAEKWWTCGRHVRQKELAPSAKVRRTTPERGRARAARVGGRDRDRAGDQEERELLESAHGALETLAPGPPAGVLNSGLMGVNQRT